MERCQRQTKRRFWPTETNATVRKFISVQLRTTSYGFAQSRTVSHKFVQIRTVSYSKNAMCKNLRFSVVFRCFSVVNAAFPQSGDFGTFAAFASRRRECPVGVFPVSKQQEILWQPRR
jgi:hypothetical protein